jgi:hypothetical protein
MILKEVDRPVENLAALIRSAPPNTRAIDFAMLMVAAKDVKLDGQAVAYFTYLLAIHSVMATPADRKAVDDSIGIESAFIYRDLQSDGDGLTQMPQPSGSIQRYGEYEIKEAREVIRKMQALFACAADDK